MTDSLVQLSIELTRIIVPIIMVIGMVGNSLNIAVLTRPALYNHACSRYFLAVGCNNLLFTSVMLIYALMADGYQRDLATVSLLSCKLVTYAYHACFVVSPHLIILASIDRYCVSSTNVHLRKFSNIKVTRWAILFVVIISLLFYMNTAILIDLRANDTFGCRIRGDTIYNQIYPIIQVILFAIIVPGLMAFFGMMTIYNTKRVGVIPTAISRHRRTENQLIIMLLVQVSTHVVLTVPACITYLIVILPNTINTTSAFYFSYILSRFPIYLSYAMPFFLYLLSARTYRKELIHLIYKIFRLRAANQIHPTTNTIAITMIPINRTAHRL